MVDLGQKRYAMRTFFIYNTFLFFKSKIKSSRSYPKRNLQEAIQKEFQEFHFLGTAFMLVKNY